MLVFRAVRKFVFHPGEALLICRMAWWVSVLSIAVRIQPLPRALRSVAGTQSLSIGKGALDVQIANRLARSIDQLLSIDMLIFRPVCWKRAAILHRYLTKSGIASRIVFGVRNGKGAGVSGHAWLEAEGSPILETEVPDYVVTYTFPSQGPCKTDLALLSVENKTA